MTRLSNGITREMDAFSSPERTHAPHTRVYIHVLRRATLDTIPKTLLAQSTLEIFSPCLIVFYDNGESCQEQ